MDLHLHRGRLKALYIFLTLVAADMIFDLTLVADSIAADTSIGSTSLMAVMMSGIACDVS